MRNGGSRTYQGTHVVTATDQRVSLYGNRETARMEESCCLTFTPTQARAVARRMVELIGEEVRTMVPCDGCKQDVTSVTSYTDSHDGCVELCADCGADLLDCLISNMTCAQFRQALESWQAEKGAPTLAPGKAGTVSARDLNTFAMGDGSGKECRVVRDGWVMMYVGIGWIKERQARQEDCDRFPMVV